MTFSDQEKDQKKRATAVVITRFALSRELVCYARSLVSRLNRESNCASQSTTFVCN